MALSSLPAVKKDRIDRDRDRDSGGQMALVKYGNGVAAMSGKVAGNVHARNKAGAYVRSWAKPTSTPTIKQSQNRARFGNQSALWGSLTSSQRDGWNSAAPGTQLLNRLGDPYVPTGRQLALSSNNQLVAAQEAQIPDVPADFVPPEISPDITIPGAAVLDLLDSLDLTGTGVDATKIYQIEATGQMPNIKQNLTNVYRVIGQAAGSALAIDLVAMWSAAYGPTAITGNVIWFRLKTVNIANGVASAPLIIQTVLT
jgi:hypothetical protein